MLKAEDAMLDRSQRQRASSRTTALGRHAVVIGGSIGGLLAARLLTDFFERVTIFERDHKVAHGHRERAPQARHVHVLLARGCGILSELFPGIVDQLVARGAVWLDLLNEIPFYLGGWHTRCPGKQLPGLFQSRTLLERILDDRVCALAGVELRDRVLVTGISFDRRREARAAAIRDLRSNRVEQIEADLIVDASGRGSKLPRWLTKAGFDAPPVSEVRCGVNYVTCTYQQPREPLRWRGMIVSTEPPDGRAGAAFPIEGDQLMVSLGCLDSDGPAPSTMEEFVDFANRLPVRDLYQAVARGVPTSTLVAYRVASSVRRHYERCALPGRLLALGDATCSVNPRYSQGMTLAAMQTLALRQTLEQTSRRRLATVGTRFARRCSGIVDLAWPDVVSTDSLYPGAPADHSQRGRLFRWYRGKIISCSRRDPEVRAALARVTNFLDSPGRLYRPRLALRILVRGRRAAWYLRLGFRLFMRLWSIAGACGAAVRVNSRR